MQRLALVPVILALAAGCADAPPVAQAAGGPLQVAAGDPNARKQVCVREQPVGSAIPVTKCHYEEDGVERAQNIGAFENQVHRSTPTTMGGGG